MLIAGLASLAALAMLSAPVASAAARSAGSFQRGTAGREPAGLRAIGSPRAISLPAGDRLACPAAAQPGRAECQAVLRQPVTSQASAISGLSPDGLRSAYQLSKAAVRDGRGETVAIVAAYGDPAAAANLTVYRSHYRLPACTAAGGCLRIVNEHGKSAPLPAANTGWAADQALSLDVISALCPACHLVLVEAATNSYTDLGTAEDAAVAAGARFVLNGWYGPESVGQDAYDHYFNHPGVAIVDGAGGTGYGRTFPADLPYVTSVGGTVLSRSKYNTRHWAETAWADTGSGCSALEVKPSWQKPDDNAATGCLNRTQNDVAADADPSTGAAIYNTVGTSQHWTEEGGTVLAAAIVTAIYALAGTPARNSYPASYPYQHAGHLFDVTFGSNGPCTLNPPYICNAGKGYDGPSGLGTPDGIAAFSAAGTDPVTVMNPGPQDDEAGTAVAFRIAGFDSRKGGGLRYSATGLPAGLSIKPVPHSTSAEITGKLPAAVGSYSVTVTAKDTKTGRADATRFAIVAAGSLTPSSPLIGAIDTDTSFSTPPAEGQCLDSGAGTAGTVVTIQSCTGTAEQLWTYLPEGAPGVPDELTINGLCLGLASGTVALATCDRSTATQSWRQLYGGVLEDTGSGRCLQVGSSWTNPLTLQTCDISIGYQQWHLVTGTVQSGVSGMCMATQDSGITNVPPPSIMVEPCGQSGQDYGYSFGLDGQILASYGFCVVPGSGGYIDGAGGTCDSSVYSDWLAGPGGELINEGNGLCLDDPGDSAVAGTQLILKPCYGTLGEIWAIA